MAAYRGPLVNAMHWLVFVVLISGCSPRLAAEAECVRKLDYGDGGIKAVAFSPDGKILAAGGILSPFGLWDVASGEKFAALPPGPGGSIWDLSFSPDGKSLASAGGDDPVALWDIATRKQKATLAFLPKDRHALSLAFSPDGKTLASNERGVIVFWDVATGKKITAARNVHPGSARLGV